MDANKKHIVWVIILQVLVFEVVILTPLLFGVITVGLDSTRLTNALVFGEIGIIIVLGLVTWYADFASVARLMLTMKQTLTIDVIVLSISLFIYIAQIIIIGSIYGCVDGNAIAGWVLSTVNGGASIIWWIFRIIQSAVVTRNDTSLLDFVDVNVGIQERARFEQAIAIRVAQTKNVYAGPLLQAIRSLGLDVAACRRQTITLVYPSQINTTVYSTPVMLKRKIVYKDRAWHKLTRGGLILSSKEDIREINRLKDEFVNYLLQLGNGASSSSDASPSSSSASSPKALSTASSDLLLGANLYYDEMGEHPSFIGKPLSIDMCMECPEDKKVTAWVGKKKDEIAISVTIGQCIICKTRGVDTAILPCGHATFCATCANLLKECPTCKGPITRLLRIYLS